MKEKKRQEEFGRVMKASRILKGISAQELGLAVGVTDASIYNYESGLFVPTLITAKKISDVLGVSLDTLANELK